MEHPQTKEIINPIGRMSCFVPANIPIQIGMLLAPSTVSELFILNDRLSISFCGSGSTSPIMLSSTTVTVTPLLSLTPMISLRLIVLLLLFLCLLLLLVTSLFRNSVVVVFSVRFVI